MNNRFIKKLHLIKDYNNDLEEECKEDFKVPRQCKINYLYKRQQGCRTI